MSGTRSEMSEPSASSTLAMPRRGWCMSTTYEPSAYSTPSAVKALSACDTSTPFAMSWSTRVAASVAERCDSSIGIT